MNWVRLVNDWRDKGEGRTEKGGAIHDYKVCFGEEREWIQSANSIAELSAQYTGRAQASPSLCMV